MNCPACHKNTGIGIYAERTVLAYLDSEDNVVASDEISGLEWGNANNARCFHCRWSGTVGQLLTEEQVQEEDPS